MNKLIVHGTTSFYGGVATVIEQLIQYQLLQGYQIAIMYPNNQSALIKASKIASITDVIRIPVKDINTPGGYIAFGLPIKKTMKYLKKTYKDIDIIFHMHNPASVGILNNINNLPIICTIHGIDFSNTNNPFYSLVYKNILNKRILFTAVSNHTSCHYARFSKFKIIVIPNGLNDISVKHITRYNGFFNVGFIGELDDLKGWKYLFDAYTILPIEAQNKIHLTFVGRGSKQEIDELLNKIKLYKLEDKVKYIGQVTNAGDIIIPNLDLVVLPSEMEGLPMVLLEAIKYGVPILATNVGGISEVLEDGLTGYFITRNKEDIADKILRLFENNTLYENISECGVKKFKDKFTINVIGKLYDELYKNIINQLRS